MGFPFRVLLLPARGAPLGATPLLSFPGPARRRNRRDSRGFSVSVPPTRRKRHAFVPSASADGQATQPGRGMPKWHVLHPRKRMSQQLGKPYPRGWSPLQGFLLRHLEAGDSRPKPLVPFDRECSLQFHSRAGFQGIGVRRKRLVSLETAGLPEVSHLIAHPRLFERPPSWLMVSPPPRGPARKRTRDFFGRPARSTGVQRGTRGGA
jgi:hypothetical protein